eukprot:TRINITY_DN4484_c0_g1_i3.p1 TRINITY_DN4484_c0_g1~~TRINITY_DN4484_c0_g1_i3.p1  ORF type:complete len:119 (-),score=18.59 TRINITY_DN4484_c0_g1_i3:486-842(-)
MGEQAETINWNPSRNRFETQDKKCYLEYQMIAEGGAEGAVTAIDLIHTYVPPSRRGRGTAALLCSAAFNHARQNSLLVVPSCSYVSGQKERYIRRKEDFFANHPSGDGALTLDRGVNA